MQHYTRIAALCMTLLAPVTGALAIDEQGVPWGYSKADGFATWAELDFDYDLCASGVEQSPINITQYHVREMSPLDITYQEADLPVWHNGHTIQVDAVGSGWLTLEGMRYELLQFHFHTPSEHYIDGSPYPMELHFVHQAIDGARAIVAVMLELGEAHPTIEQIWQVVPEAIGRSDVVLSLSASSLLPTSRDYYRYDGSLTTPPCSEGIVWHVLKEPIQISAEQLRLFQALFPVNARPVQPLGEREIDG